MPHLAIEYSANLEGRADIDALCERLLKTVLETGLFEVGAVRVRAFRAEHYAIADRLPENAFVDLNFRIGQGRTEGEKKRTGEAIFAAAIDVLGPLFETPHFALSLEIREIDAELSWKKNAMHPRLRGK
ncbi:5-carboxymethyl-2-hydroxymuconate Delta-isomerase [Rhizobium sp. CNPSo 4039]|uniref:5-carboxymethyl-2-hydroxymuconate Delta-isomerase n=1 Tax=Rhizobium sp. CNPSo 4039 TaxID=3021409 RepID=UPI00254D5FAF|nr:5-carboxymethyl-2-hydroxymuconate Delta-isomerase [Rhizobium sp. CNPSo 4039]MDK4715644.1 5-carboxymethyl-2-hydroxymuconate Delta-isomerase [Rhizobium sp. CNPSo 4039]